MSSHCDPPLFSLLRPIEIAKLAAVSIDDAALPPAIEKLAADFRWRTLADLASARRSLIAWAGTTAIVDAATAVSDALLDKRYGAAEHARWTLPKVPDDALVPDVDEATHRRLAAFRLKDRRYRFEPRDLFLLTRAGCASLADVAALSYAKARTYLRDDRVDEVRVMIADLADQVRKGDPRPGFILFRSAPVDAATEAWLRRTDIGILRAPSLGPRMLDRLRNAGLATLWDIGEVDLDTLEQMQDFSRTRVHTLQERYLAAVKGAATEIEADRRTISVAEEKRRRDEEWEMAGPGPTKRSAAKPRAAARAL